MLKNYVKIYIPGTKDVNIPLSRAEKRMAVENVAAKLSARFGGCTIESVQGYYTDSTGKLVVENISRAVSFHDHDTESALEFIRSLATELKAEYTQESISIETEAGLDFI